LQHKHSASATHVSLVVFAQMLVGKVPDKEVPLTKIFSRASHPAIVVGRLPLSRTLPSTEKSTKADHMPMEEGRVDDRALKETSNTARFFQAP